MPPFRRCNRRLFTEQTVAECISAEYGCRGVTLLYPTFRGYEFLMDGACFENSKKGIDGEIKIFWEVLEFRYNGMILRFRRFPNIQDNTCLWALGRKTYGFAVL